jgi:hypothetical protein
MRAPLSARYARDQTHLERGPRSSLDRRVPRMPIRRILEGTPGPHEQFLAQMCADQLHAQRKALPREAGWQRDRRMA